MHFCKLYSNLPFELAKNLFRRNKLEISHMNVKLLGKKYEVNMDINFYIVLYVDTL